MGRRLAYIGLICLSLLLSACGGRLTQKEKAQIDSLNTRAYRFRYVDIDSLLRLASEALSLSAHYPDGLNEARTHLAFFEYLQMNYDGVDSILKLVREESQNQLLLLSADVMQMKRCQRIGDGTRFFKAKSEAENRLRRIREEEDELTPRDVAIWVYGQSEFHIITSTYYFYQEQDSLAQVELARVLPSFEQHVDTAQWVNYNYMLGPGGLVQGENERDITLKEFDYLYKAYGISHDLGIRYFEANSLQALASMFLKQKSLIAAERQEAFRILESQHSDMLVENGGDLALTFALQALKLFKEYKDLFQTACTYRTLGEVYFDRGYYNLAKENYEQALHCVNLHHLRYYGAISPDTLTAFNPDNLEFSVEKEWIEDPRVSTIPDWIAGIRQQFSLTFSALGNKQASDYNRNFYLDLLEATNQNQELESRSAELMHQTKGLYLRMLVCILLMITALILFLLLRFRLTRHSSSSMKEIQSVYSFLQTGSLPQNNTEKAPPLLRTYQRFVAWATERRSELEEKREELEERLQVSVLRITENKLKNAENRAKVSLVHAIVPFLDRIGGEVVRMNQQGSVGAERRQYITELVDQIEQYNSILTEWIKMEQGQLNLHISTFPLQKLYDIIAEGHYSFDQQKIKLCVEPIEAYVKADESLTLFMINTLADNARKFTPEGGRVTISAEETDEYVEVQVTDTGYGLSEEDVDTLTNNKVYDADKIGVENGNKGYGFGLMNCRGIIEKYKKTSSMFSCCAFGVRSRLGEGSTFYFRLPRVARLLVWLLFIPVFTHADEINALYDSVYLANVESRYEDAIVFAGQLLDAFNKANPDQPSLQLIDTLNFHHEDHDLQWVHAGVPVDYSLIVGLRNEVALAALALNDWELYHFNNRICIRLHKYLHQDKTLPNYYHRLEQNHQNGNLLMVFTILAILMILFMAYKLLIRGQMEKEREIEGLKAYLLQLSDVAMTQPQMEEFMTKTNEQPSMRRWAEDYRRQVADISVVPINQLEEECAQLGDECSRQDYEENRLYVQNQVLDNCLSSIKHESMYYPSRIRLLVEKMQDTDIEQFSELVQYYRHLYTLLCRQADAQVSQPGFKRQQLKASEVLIRAGKTSQHLIRKGRITATSETENQLESESYVIGDEILLDTLFESLLVGMLHDNAQIQILATDDDSFVRFSLCDRSMTLPSEQLDNLFYPEAGHISYLVAKQILREHDTYANHPGCRLVAEAHEEGYAICFTLKKAKR